MYSLCVLGIAFVHLTISIINYLFHLVGERFHKCFSEQFINNFIFPIFHVNYLIILFDEFKTIKLDLDLG